jgi:hypothetical protein
MILYTGLGFLVVVFFLAPLVVIGAILFYGFGIDFLRSPSWWPLHSLMILGAILTFVVGSLLNRNMLEETTYEKSGPVRVLRSRHTLYYIRMEYWGPIVLVVYFALIAYRSLR